MIAEEVDRVVKYYHSNHLGSTRLVTDASGNVVASYKFKPYGETGSHTGAFETKYEFTGKPLDADVGLYYFGARWYDPETGRFITRDPAKDGLNWYLYCNNNPLLYLDPDGRESVLSTIWNYTVATVEVGGGALGLIGGYSMIAAGIAASEIGVGILGVGGGLFVAAHGANTLASGLYDFRCLLSGNSSGFGKFNWLKDNIYSKLPAGSTLYYVADILTGVKGTASAFNTMFKGVSNISVQGAQLSYKIGNA